MIVYLRGDAAELHTRFEYRTPALTLLDSAVSLNSEWTRSSFRVLSYIRTPVARFHYENIYQQYLVLY